MNSQNSGDYSGMVMNASGQVGIQAVHVTGSTVHMGNNSSIFTTEDLSALLSELQNQIAHEHSTGRLDSETYAAAQKELVEAKDALTVNAPTSKTKFTLALKRLRGLIDDISEITVKVVALIAAAKGMS